VSTTDTQQVPLTRHVDHDRGPGFHLIVDPKEYASEGRRDAITRCSRRSIVGRLEGTRGAAFCVPQLRGGWPSTFVLSRSHSLCSSQNSWRSASNSGCRRMNLRDGRISGSYGICEPGSRPIRWSSAEARLVAVPSGPDCERRAFALSILVRKQMSCAARSSCRIDRSRMRNFNRSSGSMFRFCGDGRGRSQSGKTPNGALSDR
jgi:hypothetical protein